MRNYWRYPRAVICVLAVILVPVLGAQFGSQFGPTVTLYAQGVFSIFKNLWIAPAIAISMVVLAFVLLGLYLVLYVSPITTRIELFRRKIASIDGYFTVDEFEKIDQLARQNRTIAHGWQEFSETLVPPDDT